MGRFASTVDFYERFRPPYPPEFFAEVARRVPLAPDQRLIDLGTGPGLLALGFAPFVGEVVGVDPEPAMLRRAEANAAAAHVALRLLAGTTETLPDGIGRFDAVTIGRALHWMEPEATRAVLARIVAADGAILICASRSAAGAANPWLGAYDEARRGWEEQPKPGYRLGPADYFAGSAFGLRETVTVRHSQAVSVDHLVGRVFSMSSTAPARLGDRAAAVEAAVRAALAPFAGGGDLTEIIEASAAILVRRTGRG